MWNVEVASDERKSGLAPVHRAIDRHAPYKRIATEEAWNIPEILEAQVRLLDSANAPDDPSLRMAGMFAKIAPLQEQLMDLGERRIARMDELGIDKQLLLLTSPGVQVLEPDEGSALARLANDRLAEVCRRHPNRFAGLAVFAPQDVPGAVSEIERGMKTLGLNGAVINSHFRGRYLDEAPYWPILEALEANDAALYIHPTIPPKAWSQPYEFRGFGGALAGFSHEVWMHTMGLIMSGAFDRFPKLRIVIGHMGEGMPLLLYRFDWMQSNADGKPGLRGGAPAVTLRHKISYYFKRNIWITTSGQGWEPSVKFCMDVLGPDRVIYAMDYPYQQSADEVAAYDAFELRPEHKKMLMQTNAEQVFRLNR
ncbi:MAG: amidohydrolase family protein [Steroidobacteraceae bacterium]